MPRGRRLVIKLQIDGKDQVMLYRGFEAIFLSDEAEEN
jgi:hypothetical protein